MKYSNQHTGNAMTSQRQEAWSLAAAIAALLCGLLMATGCNQDKTGISVNDPVSGNNPPTLGSGDDTGFTGCEAGEQAPVKPSFEPLVPGRLPGGGGRSCTQGCRIYRDSAWKGGCQAGHRRAVEFRHRTPGRHG